MPAHMAEVSGKPCSNSTGDPLPPCTMLIFASPVSMRVVSNPSNTSAVRGLVAPGRSGQLPEVPAGDLVRDQPQPPVPAVVLHRPAAVLVGEGLLRADQVGDGLAGARHLADDLDPSAQLDPAQLVVALARVDDRGDARIALQV